MPFGRKAPPPRDPGTVHLFNMDFHLAVIADVKDVLGRVFGDRVEITDWSLNPVCGSKLGFRPSTKSRGRGDVIGLMETGSFQTLVGRVQTAIHKVKFMTYDFDDVEINAFTFLHAGEMKKYDGFVVTHSPVLCRLFEQFGKPIVLVNSCRYDQPYCWTHNDRGRSELNSCLRRLRDKGLLHIVSNNKADQEYLRLGAGMESLHLPSLCLYTGVEYDPLRASSNAASFDPSEHKFGNSRCLIQANASVSGGMSKGLNEAIEKTDFLSGDAALLKGTLRSWDEIYQRKGIVHFPYEMSTMSIFEQYSAGVPLLVPSQRLLNELVESRLLAIVSSYWESGEYMISKREGAAPVMARDDHTPAFQRFLDATKHVERDDGFYVAKREVPCELLPSTQRSFWIEKADFYDEEWMPAVITFDSFEELAIKLDKPLQTDEQRCAFTAHQSKRRDTVLSEWKKLMLLAFPILEQELGGHV